MLREEISLFEENHRHFCQKTAQLSHFYNPIGTVSSVAELGSVGQLAHLVPVDIVRRYTSGMSMETAPGGAPQTPKGPRVTKAKEKAPQKRERKPKLSVVENEAPIPVTPKEGSSHSFANEAPVDSVEENIEGWTKPLEDTPPVKKQEFSTSAQEIAAGIRTRAAARMKQKDEEKEAEQLLQQLASTRTTKAEQEPQPMQEEAAYNPNIHESELQTKALLAEQEHRRAAQNAHIESVVLPGVEAALQDEVGKVNATDAYIDEAEGLLKELARRNREAQKNGAAREEEIHQEILRDSEALTERLQAKQETLERERAAEKPWPNRLQQTPRKSVWKWFAGLFTSKKNKTTDKV